MKVVHHVDFWNGLRPLTQREPLRLLLSGCLHGWPCGVNGTDYGLGQGAPWLSSPLLNTVAFCPEEFSLGTPRTMPDIHGGDGFDVLDGSARVLDEHGSDLTGAMILGAERMLTVARQHRAELCLLTDMSAACGTQVISLGCRYDHPRRYQLGVGVAAAALIRAGFPVMSQRDHAAMSHLRAAIDSAHEVDPNAIDHHQHPWTLEYFANSERA